MLSPLLFTIVMEAVTHNVREGLPWEMLYADDLVLVGKCQEELKELARSSMVNSWSRIDISFGIGMFVGICLFLFLVVVLPFSMSCITT